MNNAMTWKITDHICRHCSGGRILECVSGCGPTPGGNPIYKCADCGKTVSGLGSGDLCWCGQSFRNNHHLQEYICVPFSVLKDKPYLKGVFMSFGCDPDRGEVGIMTQKAYRDACEKGMENKK